MIVFLYRIINRCGIVWFTKDSIYAEQASRHGCLVTCKTVNDNKIFKGSKHKFVGTATQPIRGVM